MADIIIWNSRVFYEAPVRPGGAHQIASWMRQHGYTVKVIDFCFAMSTEDLVSITEKHIDEKTLAVGVSSTFWRHGNDHVRVPAEPPWVINARIKIEGKYPKLKWLLGGAFSQLPKCQFEWKKFHGLAEDELLRWADENRSKLIRRDLFNIATTTKFYQENDFILPDEVLPMELGRGCQFKCRFCSYPLIGKKKGTYLRNFDTIKEEFIRNYNEYGTTKYYFLDDTLNESEEKVQALADIAQSLPFEISWTGYNRLDLIWSRPATLQTLLDSGLKSTFFGIESFHPVAANAVGKGWNGKQAKDFLLQLRDKWQNKVLWSLGFIIGLPGENEDSIENTHNWCVANKMPNWIFYPLYINRESTNVWKSEFELNYSDYGYKFPPEKHPYEWESDGWNWHKARRLAEKLNKDSNEYATVGAWVLAELTNHGYSYNELMNVRRKDLPWDIFAVQTNDFVKAYVEKNLG